MAAKKRKYKIIVVVVVVIFLLIGAMALMRSHRGRGGGGGGDCRCVCGRGRKGGSGGGSESYSSSGDSKGWGSGWGRGGGKRYICKCGRAFSRGSIEDAGGSRSNVQKSKGTETSLVLDPEIKPQPTSLEINTEECFEEQEQEQDYQHKKLSDEKRKYETSDNFYMEKYEKTGENCCKGREKYSQKEEKEFKKIETQPFNAQNIKKIETQKTCTIEPEPEVCPVEPEVCPVEPEVCPVEPQEPCEKKSYEEECFMFLLRKFEEIKSALCGARNKARLEELEKRVLEIEKVKECKPKLEAMQQVLKECSPDCQGLKKEVPKECKPLCQEKSKVQQEKLNISDSHCESVLRDFLIRFSIKLRDKIKQDKEKQQQQLDQLLELINNLEKEKELEKQKISVKINKKICVNFPKDVVKQYKQKYGVVCKPKKPNFDETDECLEEDLEEDLEDESCDNQEKVKERMAKVEKTSFHFK